MDAGQDKAVVTLGALWRGLGPSGKAAVCMAIFFVWLALCIITGGLVFGLTLLILVLTLGFALLHDCFTDSSEDDWL